MANYDGSQQNIVGTSSDDVVDLTADPLPFSSYTVATGDGNDAIYLGNVALTGQIDGGAGRDTIYAPPDLATVAGLAVGTIAPNQTSYSMSLLGIENVVGSNLEDLIYGDTQNNRISGGAGGDDLSGREGIDTLDYRTSDAAVSVNLLTSTASGGHAEGDTIDRFEAIWGSGFGDTLIGDTQNNLIQGGVGGDDMSGGAGNDTLDYRTSDAAVSVSLLTSAVSGGHAAGDTIAGFEAVWGSGLGDTLTGDAQNNLVQGGAGGDDLSGGAGIDTVDYRTSDAAVSVNLVASTAAGGDAQSDLIDGFERAWGSEFDDTLAGDAGRNQLVGYAGDDRIDGGARADVLRGLDGADTLIGGAGGDTLTGDGSSDHLGEARAEDNDVFVYNAVSDSRPWLQRDTITEFQQGFSAWDLIDLTAIDADPSTSGDQAFRDIGNRWFDGEAGALRYGETSTGVTLQADLDGDRKVDFAIDVDGVRFLGENDLLL